MVPAAPPQAAIHRDGKDQHSSSERASSRWVMAQPSATYAMWDQPAVLLEGVCSHVEASICCSQEETPLSARHAPIVQLLRQSSHPRDDKTNSAHAPASGAVDSGCRPSTPQKLLHASLAMAVCGKGKRRAKSGAAPAPGSDMNVGQDPCPFVTCGSSCAAGAYADAKPWATMLTKFTTTPSPTCSRLTMPPKSRVAGCARMAAQQGSHAVQQRSSAQMQARG